MSRGLGPIQRAILRIGFKRFASGQDDAVVLARDIKITCYGFPPIRPIESARRNATMFRKADIGLRRYNIVSVTISESFKRMVRRGLVEPRRWGRGYKLTKEGIELARMMG